MESRELTETERGILDLLLTRDFPGRDALMVQAKTVRTFGRSCICGCPTFALDADTGVPPAEVLTRMPSDAHGSDPNGHLVGVLLFVEEGYLSEIEIYGRALNDHSELELPAVAALKLSEWSNPDGTGSLLNP